MKKIKTGKALMRFSAVLLTVISLLTVAAAVPLGAETAEIDTSAAEVSLPAERLIPGGMAFGVRMQTKGLIVVGITKVGSRSPAEEADIRVRDVILSIDGKEVNSADEVTDAIGQSGGRPLRVTILRAGKTGIRTLKPEKSADGVYKAGIWIRDSTAGIGTVTYIDPESGNFGGLGHGICDADTGDLVPLRTGTATEVTIAGVKKGVKGVPGELKGYLTAKDEGILYANTEVGVFGKLDTVPASETIAVAGCGDVREGKAEIRCTLDGNGIGTYQVELSSISRSGGETKNFMITVTDPVLLEKTGGIVQGMSGSPVIQNGKLIGAVTHVLITDPKKGYGIFIENMLSHSV